MNKLFLAALATGLMAPGLSWSSSAAVAAGPIPTLTIDKAVRSGSTISDGRMSGLSA